MTVDVTRWSQAYLADLDRAAATLPPDRRAELREQIDTHLQAELGAAMTDEDARRALDRLGDPADLVAEAAADLPAPRSTPGPAAGEIVALLLMGLGGIALPLVAPAIGVLFMRATPRWSRSQVRTAWLILSFGVVAVLCGVGLATIPDPSAQAGWAALALIAVIVAVGPVCALYAATRPRD